MGSDLTARKSDTQEMPVGMPRRSRVGRVVSQASIDGVGRNEFAAWIEGDDCWRCGFDWYVGSLGRKTIQLFQMGQHLRPFFAKSSLFSGQDQHG